MSLSRENPEALETAIAVAEHGHCPLCDDTGVLSDRYCSCELGQEKSQDDYFRYAQV